MSTYNVINLFNEPETLFINQAKKRRNLFTDHDAFVEKFEAKKTTDDCYTPPEVFDIVLEYVNQHYDLTGKTIMRPFYPGGDFESMDYPLDAVVIDNPPFSIISKIAKFYLQHGIGFFLFAPHLTLFSSDIDCTHIVVGGDITYENGAQVKTSFLSNLFGDAKIIGDAALAAKFKALADSKKINLPKYVYPPNIITVSHVAWVVERGISLRINKGHTRHCRGLEAQKKHGKAIFGSGFLISEKAAAEKAAAEKENIIVWELSEKEKQIIESLKS